MNRARILIGDDHKILAKGIRSPLESEFCVVESVQTAEAHKARILETLNLHRTAELVHLANRNGLISVN